jgi:hypothetical protein
MTAGCRTHCRCLFHVRIRPLQVQLQFAFCVRVVHGLRSNMALEPGCNTFLPTGLTSGYPHHAGRVTAHHSHTNDAGFHPIPWTIWLTVFQSWQLNSSSGLPIDNGSLKTGRQSFSRPLPMLLTASTYTRDWPMHRNGTMVHWATFSMGW